MARMHARKKGRSGSAKPYQVKPPEWVTTTSDEVEELVVELGREGLSTSSIGIRLRDLYGVPSVKLVTGRKIGSILLDAGVSGKFPEDFENLLKKVNRLYTHIKTNPKDVNNRRGLELTEAKIRRLARYYKRSGRLPANWKYNRGEVALLVE